LGLALGGPTWPNESHPAVQDFKTGELPFPADKNIRIVQHSQSSFVAKLQDSRSYNEDTDDAKVHSGAMSKTKYVLDSKSPKGDRKEHFPESKSRGTRSSSNDSPIQARYNGSGYPELCDWKRSKTTNTVHGLEQGEMHESRRSIADKRSRGHETPEREEHSQKHSSKKLKYGDYVRSPDRETHALGQIFPDRRGYAEESSPPDREYFSPPGREYVSPPGREYVSRSDIKHYSPPKKVQNISTDEFFYYSAPARERFSLPDSKKYSQISSDEVGHSGDKSLPLVGWQDTQNDTDGKDYNSAPNRESSFLSDKEQYFPVSSNEEGHSGGRSLSFVGRRDIKNDPDKKDYYSAPDREHLSLLDRNLYSPLSSNEVGHSGDKSQPLVRQQNTQNDNIPADRHDNHYASDRGIFSLPHREQYSSSYGKEYSDSQRSSGNESHSGGRSLPVVDRRDTRNDRIHIMNVRNISAEREDKQYSSSYGMDYTDSQRSSGKESHSDGRSLPVVGQQDTQYTQNDEINEAEWRQIPSKSFIGNQSSRNTVQSAGLKPSKGRDDDAGRSNTSYSIDLINSALVSSSFLIGV